MIPESSINHIPLNTNTLESISGLKLLRDNQSDKVIRFFPYLPDYIAQWAISEYHYLKTTFEINVVNHMWVKWGEYQHKPHMLVIADHLEYRDMWLQPDFHIDVIDELYCKLWLYFEQRFLAGEKFLWDIFKLNQYTINEFNGRNQAVLIDLDPYWSSSQTEYTIHLFGEVTLTESCGYAVAINHFFGSVSDIKQPLPKLNALLAGSKQVAQQLQSQGENVILIEAAKNYAKLHGINL